MDFLMAVGKGEPAGSVVVACRNILPVIGVWIVDEKTIVYGVGMVVQKEPVLRGFQYPGLF